MDDSPGTLELTRIVAAAADRVRERERERGERERRRQRCHFSSEYLWESETAKRVT